VDQDKPQKQIDSIDFAKRFKNQSEAYQNTAGQ